MFDFDFYFPWQYLENPTNFEIMEVCFFSRLCLSTFFIKRDYGSMFEGKSTQAMYLNSLPLVKSVMFLTKIK